ncbi:MAG: dihydropteroate synthase [Acidobacteriaceae bacterium]|nr:dihydropteroate synthase [Acidobacteriaceae bacterium]
MGVLNVTPDSFSDGAQYLAPERAIEYGLQLLKDGADIVDVGGESTRPGAAVMLENRTQADVSASTKKETKKAVTEEEELKRVIPVIRAMKQQRPQAIVSIDTYKANVAKAAVEVGAEIVNDVSGFRWDPQMIKTLASLQCGAVLMHMRGTPEDWRNLPEEPDIVVLVKRELRDWANVATLGGIKRERLVLDPGFGFGKSFEGNYPLLKRFDEFHELRYPLLVGVSRKSFVGRALARNGHDAPVAERAIGTVAMETALILRGAHIIRTHDVRVCADAAKIADIVVN